MELSRREVAVRTLRCSAEHELVQGGSTMDARWLQIQMEELEDRWELVGRLSVSQQNRLEVTLRQACGQATGQWWEKDMVWKAEGVGRGTGRRLFCFPSCHHHQKPPS